MTWKSTLVIAWVSVGVLGCSSPRGAGETGGGTSTGGHSGGRGGAAGSGAASNVGSMNGGREAGGARGAHAGGAGVSSNGAAGGRASAIGGSPGTGGSAINGGRGGTGGAATGGSSGSARGGGAATGGNAASGGASSGGASSGGASSGVGGAASDTVDATTMVAAMGFGTNIGNTLENTSSWETGWGQPLITQAYVNGMASRGIKTVRVPVAWNTYAINGVIDSAKMDRVKQVVSWIATAGMYSIVNIHWDGGWIDNDTEGNGNKYKLTADVKTKFASYWTQIATAFKAVGHQLVFEGLNEESRFYVNGDTSQAPDYAALNALNQLFVTTVRGQGGYNASRALLIAGFATDIELTCVDAFAVPNDPAGPGKLFLSIHYYTPFTFCGLETVESWGSPQTTWGTDAERATLTSLFDQLDTFSTRKKIPVILGEFAVTPGQSYPRQPASRVSWMEAVVKAALSRGMVPVLWDTGSEISRADGSFSTELQTVMGRIK